MAIRIIFSIAVFLVFFTSEVAFARKVTHADNSVSATHNLRHKKQAEGFAIVLTRTLLKKVADTRRGKTESKIAPQQDAHAAPHVFQLQQSAPNVITALANSLDVALPTTSTSPPRHALIKSLFVVVISPNAP